MKKVHDLFQKIISVIFIVYIRLVYATSKIELSGNGEYLKSNHEEKFIFSFWHGSSYSFYPLLKGERLCVVTTKDPRGNYISNICKSFGYVPIRVPDEPSGGNFFLKIRSIIREEANSSVAITFDGPLGPFHEPKIFPFAVALFSKRRVVPLSIRVRRKISLNKRWDKFVIPFPFNEIKVCIHEPVEVNKEDLKKEFIEQRIKVRTVMEQWENTGGAL
ncbi:MAG: DUF374 domain-containing protein [Epulopiscium sp.]|nr:DUF374 domain-containing protein [Candidatus Epulonipiscium sp.]